MNKQENNRVGLSFIDILFAIVVGIGFREAINRPWVANLAGNLERIDFWVFVLSNTVVICSWVGYHKMMQDLDPAIRTWQGLSRFIIDVVLLFEYFRLLMSLNDPRSTFAIIFQVFVLYVAWDLIVATEQPTRKKRLSVTIVWCLIFGALWWLASHVPWTAYEQVEWRVLILGGIAAALLYRLHGLLWKNPNEQTTGPLRIYIAGPYSDSSEEQMQRNVERAIDTALRLYKKGHHPYVPHLTHYIDKRAKTLGVNMAWEDWVSHWDCPWIEQCDAMLFLAESRGSLEELKMAQDLGIKVFYNLEGVPPAESPRPE